MAARNDFKISSHFSGTEAECPCCGLIVVRPLLVALLEAIRMMKGGKPLVVTSWCRCIKEQKRIYEKINRERRAKGLSEVVGYMRSPHLVGPGSRLDGGGFAADVATWFNLPDARLLLDLGARGVGLHETFTHVDVMPRKGEDGRVWVYDNGRPDLVLVRKGNKDEVLKEGG